MKTILKISIVLLVLVMCVSCEVKKSDKSDIETNPLKMVGVDPFRMVSMGLQHSFGIDIKKENSVVVVDKLKEKGPAAVAGLKNGTVIKSIGGFDIINLDKINSDKIVAQIENGAVPIIVVNDDGTEKNIDLEVTRSNCPQQRNLDFIFVSDTDNENPPSVLVAHIATRIKTGTFNQEATNTIYFYDSLNDKWWMKEDYKDDFSAGVEIEKLTGLLTPELFIDSSPAIDSGMIGYSGEKRFKLNYEISNEFDLYGKTQIGEGFLKSGNILLKGRIIVQYEEKYFILPHYKESDSPEMKPLAPDKAQVSVKVSDWIMLFDKSGSVIELSVDGALKKWLGVFMPSNTANSDDSNSLSDYLIKDINIEECKYVNLDDFNMTWFEEYETGYEADPYPDDINIIFPNDLEGEIKLKSFSPKYLHKNHRIYILLSGQFVPTDGSPIDVYGFMIRLK